ncbi:MAG TPA: TlpA disulfide reductase family protein [Bacteroidales bacterium]|nr:TlpA disulfide reductase family protein [Bacteroidales bacterium]
MNKEIKPMNVKNSISIFFLVAACVLVISCCTTEAIKCTLKGEVADRPQTNQIILYKQSEDPRIHGIVIPIVNGKFEYVLNCEHVEQYQFVFDDDLEQGSFRPVSFFSERGAIKFTLYPNDRYNENKVEGGKLTRDYWDYLTPILMKYESVKNEFIAESIKYLENNYGEVERKHEMPEDDIRAKVEQLGKDGVDINPVMQAITELQQSLYSKANRETERQALQYITEHPNIAGYSILLSETSSMIQGNQISRENNDISPYADLYRTVFAPRFPDHPYTAHMETLFAGSSIKAGVPFVDFIAIDLNGKPVKLSERIEGKPAVLYLWASWCGPCRKHGKELIPVYEEFRDKGFVVIGVAREKNVSIAENAIKSDKYPWENLVELNDTEKIWAKYGIENSGGMLFLIDENGIIVASDPSASEIRDFLINKLI